MKDSAGKQSVLIIVENLPVPLDRRVWQEACALRDGGYDVTVICPQMRGYTQAYEVLEEITIYRHWISDEASGIQGFIREYASALWGEFCCACKAWKRRRFQIIHICNPPDLLFLVALPFKVLFGVKILFDVHDIWPEMFEAKFGKRGLLYWMVRVAEYLTLSVADICIATNASVADTVKTRGRKSDEDVFIVRTSPKAIDRTTPPNPALKRGRNFLLGYIGVMGNADRVDLLIETAKILVHERNRTDIQFLIMGTGPEYEPLVAMRDRLGLADFVDLPGRVTETALTEGLKTMDLGLGSDPINSYNDHCTMNKTLEYMAFAKAQVMFGIKEGRISAGDAALYVMENSSTKLADAIEELLADPVRRQKMGEIGLQRLENALSWKESTKYLLQAYTHALHK